MSQGGGGSSWAVALGILGKAGRVRNITQESLLPGRLPSLVGAGKGGAGLVSLGDCGLEKAFQG